MSGNKDLYLFTASYPYDKAETFLEDEILYLSKGFDNITIVPLFGDSVTREVPYNCIVTHPVEKKGIKRYLALFMPHRATILFLKDFVTHKVYTSFIRFKTWLIAYRQTTNLLRNKNIKDIFKNISHKDVCYFYWGKGANILAALYEGKAHFVSRFHGEWDLWEESSGNYAPVRDRISNCLDLAAFISRKGEIYYNDRYDTKKTIVSPLGSFDKGFCNRSHDGIIRIVSCSAVYPLKRVPLLHDALLSSNRQIEWTHIGGGSQFEELKNKVLSHNREGLVVNLLGQVQHSQVIEYYLNHNVDLFVNLSTNEGIPVSIMEAISFDVPVLATNVGATSEVVCDATGLLLPANPSIGEIVYSINKIVNEIDSIHPRVFWENNYNASINYKKFTDVLLALQ